MGVQAVNNATLSDHVLKRLGIALDSSRTAPKSRASPRNRKEQRKEARNKQKTRALQEQDRKGFKDQHVIPKKASLPVASFSKDQDPSRRSNARIGTSGGLERVKKRDHDSSSDPSLQPPKRRKSRAAQEDVEIAALEGLLGLTGKKAGYTSLGDPTLDYVLDGLEAPAKVDTDAVKRVSPQVDSTRKDVPQSPSGRRSENASMGFDDDASMFEGFEDSDHTPLAQDDDTYSIRQKEKPSIDAVGDSNNIPLTKPRENPYKPPALSSPEERSRYIPPSLRKAENNGGDDLVILRKQIKGLINRLSESNILSIIQKIIDFSGHYSRHKIFQVILDDMIQSIVDPAALQDTFLLLNAGFIAGLSKRFGPDFAATAIISLDGEFQQYDPKSAVTEPVGKQALNLMSLIAHLYIFQVIGNQLVTDYIRHHLRNLNEENTESLLKIVRIAGRRLSSDDANVVKDIVGQMHTQVEQLGSNNISTRTKFMIETIESLGSKKGLKTGAAASTVLSEHTVAMKKKLGNMNAEELRMIEPLNLTLNELRHKEKVGQWWLSNPVAIVRDPSSKNDFRIDKSPNHGINETEEAFLGHDRDLVQLARENQMNTDVRRSIFFAIMSATDCDDASARLRRLRLRRKQEVETPKVLLQCAASESPYNPFYTILSQRICSDRQQKMAFQFCLWDAFKRMDKTSEDDALDDAAADNGLELEGIVNLARMFGTLVVNGSQSLALLKVLDLEYLQKGARTFVQVLLITIIKESQKKDSQQRDQAALLKAFIGPKEMPGMAGSVRYFVKKILRTTHLTGSASERGLVEWGCSVIDDALKGFMEDVT